MMSLAFAMYRTYSKNQPQNVYEDHTGSGGPGGQHCYTSGLALHYLLTGYDLSRYSVGKITGWIENFYEGTETVSNLLLAIKNRKRKDLKNVLTGSYPLDRGTGNYIRALLDLFNLTGRQSLLDKAGVIIKHTATAGENIQARNLNDVENSWFYTVFLQSVAQFLLVKENQNQLDSTYHQAKDIYLHFADWMVLNEQPYLNKPEILEYPNITWAAQDVRKAHIFSWAAHFAPTQQSKYLERYEFFMDYVTAALEKQHGNSHTRILSILMQSLIPKINHAGGPTAETAQRPLSGAVNAQEGVFRQAIWPILKKFSLSREITWLVKRFSPVQKVMNRIRQK